jgi:hypothetical protein
MAPQLPVATHATKGAGVSHFKPKSIVAGAAVVPLAALVIAGCGGSSNHQ